MALPRPVRALAACGLAASVAATALVHMTLSASAEQTIDYPTFTGPADPVPAEPASYTVDGMMPEMYEAEKDGTDFWMDRLLARTGADPAGDEWLMTRGRAALMRSHDPEVIGFGGALAYYDPYFDSISNTDGYTLTIGDGGFGELVDQRRQTPSHWKSVHTNAQDLTAEVRKFITHNNVAVTNVEITNDGDAALTVPINVDSPFVQTADGDELTGVVDVMNSRREPLTTLFPRLSGTGLAPDGEGKLAGDVTLAPGESTTVKVQLGLIANEIAKSTTEYTQLRDMSPENAFAEHVQVYNKWWADNVPYIDVPNEAIKKYVYYRWWLMRFNYVDADIPGNDFQFPTSLEGVLGYNNAIALTVPMFVDELKYLRDPAYSYGPWISTGESSQNGRFRDNPGDPENWSNTYTQYVAEAALRSYQIHGGPDAVLENLARYAEGDVKGQLDDFDTDDNWLIEYDWGAMTGNDADAVSFHWRDGNLDRAESAYQYSGALAAAEAYELIGDTAKAQEMRSIADNIGQAFLDVLWNPDSQLFEHVHVDSGDHVPWKEINNYYPFSVGAIPDQRPYTDALRLFTDPAEYPIFPFYTANQADKAEAAEQGNPGSNNFSQINSTVQFRLFSSALRNYDQSYITTEDYKKLLYWNAWAGFIDGNTSWPDSNEFWADWNENTQSIDYRSWIHHTILGSSNWTVIEDVIGLRPRSDAKVELSPIDIDWDHFTVNHLRYRDSDLTIVWDDPADGEAHYPGVPEGYSAYLDGQRAFTVDTLTTAVWDPETGDVELPDGAGTVLHSVAMPDIGTPQQVDFGATERVTDVLAKAGADVTNDAPNLAEGANVSASFSESGFEPAGAVDGATIDLPYWSTRGSSNDSDWFEVDLGEPTTFDDVKLYFYRDRSRDGLAEPTTYRVEYHDGSDWAPVDDQVNNPSEQPYPRANYNHVRFSPVTSDRVRVVLDHQDGHRTGLKEIQILDTGVAPPAAQNSAPYVLAREDATLQQPGTASLLGTVKDDALPTGGTLTSEWSVIDGPGSAIFDDVAGARTLVTFTEPGAYTLGLSADDGELESSSTVTVEVDAGTGDVNVAPEATVECSYTSGWESCDAINDGIEPTSSNDPGNPRWGTWPEAGTQSARLTWDEPVQIDASDMYFFADTPAGGSGGVQPPQSWSIEYWTGDAWADLPGASGYGVAADQYNTTTFDPITTTRLRATFETHPDADGVGVNEWQVHAQGADYVRELHVPTLEGELPNLPPTVTLVYADGTRSDAAVTWTPVDAAQVETGGTSFAVSGVVEGTSLLAHATVYVRFTDAVEITALAPEEVTTLTGVAPQLPPTVTATFNDGSRDNVSTSVTWVDIDPADYEEPGTFTATGSVEGTSIDAVANVTVVDGGAPGEPDSGNPIVRDPFTADPATLVHDGMMYLFTGRDEAAPGQEQFVMNEWHAFSSTDPTNDPSAWEHHGALMSLDTFEWSSGNAWASEVVQGPDGRFYWYVSTEWADAPEGSDSMSIGVAVADDPLGPYVDAIGEPLITGDLPNASSHNIDPTVIVDDEHGIYLYWGSYWSPRFVELTESMTELAGPIQTPEGLDEFWEAPWIFERDGTYYLAYASNANINDDGCVEASIWACIRYATADHPAGPWTHQGVVLGQVTSTTNHPAIAQFGDQWWMVYHNADAPGGGNFRRSAAMDRLFFNEGAMERVVQTPIPDEPEPEPTDNVALSATVTCSYTSPWEGCDTVNDGEEPTSSNSPAGTRWGTWPEEGEHWIEYEWSLPVRVDGSDLYWFQDSADGSGNGVKRADSWTIQYWDGSQFVDVDNADGFGTELDQFNTTSFDPVTTTRMRAVLQTRDEDADGVGVVEWKVYSDEPSGVEDVALTTAIDVLPTMPSNVTLTYDDGERLQAPVWWRPIDEAHVAGPDTFDATGVITGQLVGAEAVVTVAPTWDDTAAYTEGDEVTWDDQVFRATWWTRDDEPGDTTGSWQEIAPPDPDTGLAAWTDSRIYTEGDEATLDGRLFRATWWTRDDEPGDTTGSWQEIAPPDPDTGLAAWTDSRIYTEGDRISLDGETWEARWWNRAIQPDDNQSWGPWMKIS